LFAQAMNCERAVVGSGVRGQGAEEDTLPAKLTPCNECQSCRRIAAGTHPEVLEVRPDSKTGQNITVELAREVRRSAALRPKMGRRRIYLIPNAEAFSEDSANALLKTLEEPSESVTLILCAPNPSQVLPTIRSRCQLVRFGLAPAEEIERALTTDGTTPEIALALARASGGRPGLAFSWARTPSVLKQRRAVLDLFALAMAAQAEARRNPSAGAKSMRMAEQLKALVGEADEEEGPARPAKMLHSSNLETGLTYLRDLLVLTDGADPRLVQNQDRLAELQELARRADPQRVLDDVDSVREAQQLLDRNVQPQLVLERMFWALISGRIPAVGRLFEEAYS
jgi:DNA polymerase-3 subunit delta'